MKLPRPKLSSRMVSFLEHALKNQPLWDVCCDHGYVGIKAMESGAFSEVHFVDQVPHIMDRLETLISQTRIAKNHRHFLHRKAGEELEAEIHGTLLIAGVGGLTIKNILENLIAKKALKAKRFLLSPHSDEKVLLNLLESESFQQHYDITQKILLPEGPRHRPLYIIDLR